MPPDGNPKGRSDEDTIASTDPYWRRQVNTLQAENERLCTQVKIAEDALEHIVQCADRGLKSSLLGVYAHDALIRMSVVE